MPVQHRRFDRLDALRGLALVWMAVYHFCFDLNHFGLMHQSFAHDPFWTLQRTAIVSLFLFTAGFGQVLALQAGQGWRRFVRRWAQVVGCALLVSLASWLMFPRSWISFGVLHGLAVMLLLVRWALARGGLRGAWPWGLGVLLIVASLVSDRVLPAAEGTAWAAALDSRWLYGLGLITHKPFTEDYVPLLPWLGVVLLGVGAGQRVSQAWLMRPVGGPGRVLVGLGRWSLSFYMLHQPVLMGILMVFVQLRR